MLICDLYNVNFKFGGIFGPSNSRHMKNEANHVMKELKVTENEGNQRVDKYLQKYFNTAPKSLIYKLIRKKKVKLNGKRIEGNEILCEGNTLQIYLSDDTMDSFKEAKVLNERADGVDIIYEDKNVLVCNKPVGVLSHPKNARDKNTLIDQILLYLYKNGEFDIGKDTTFTPAICNRLDRNTSGVVICGKNLPSVQSLNKIFAERKVDKFYYTIVKGEIKKGGLLEGYHLKDKSQNQVVIYKEERPDTTKILTEYIPVKSSKKFTLLEIKLITGKSHQIRAHLKFMGNPIVGDPKYGDLKINAFVRSKIGLENQLLHAERLVITEKIGNLAYICGKEFIANRNQSFEKSIKFLL